MASVGLLFVGAVLFINGVMLLGWIDARSAAPMNFFVGGLQIITPLYLIFTADGDADVVLAASGLFLFSFTYLYVAVNLTWDLDGTGLGYFCLFVAITALVFSVLNFTRFADPAFGVIWLHWAFLWSLFFVLLGRRRDGIGRYTGAVCAIQGWVTAWIPALLLLTGVYAEIGVPLAIGLAIFGVVVYAALVPWARRQRSAPPTPAPAGEHVPA
ncbi:AmiS/UreI family transporter [Actinomycetospora straminea]|uniref:AmiS/UreI family transporter n=1 Tax=Actinomycetospora straminea TaxID=663607 RepID=A0ABP9EHF4_9PSEU|nr:AmiS/UreI family transporter [Actinomycetospora straminea]MDD7935654.1 AmiS/UreI family transporter [Actinomycetospora straminea]